MIHGSPKESDLVQMVDAQERGVVKKQKPKIVCLCGSTRFSDAFHKHNLLETLVGNIVLSIGCDIRSDGDLDLFKLSIIWNIDTKADEEEAVIEEIKDRLDELHLRKIDLADEVLILNVGGYIGESTQRELDYAREHGKIIRYLEKIC